MKWLHVKSKFRVEEGQKLQMRLLDLKRARVLDFDTL